MQAIEAGAFSAPIHILTFTPELQGELLQGELSNISKFGGHGLVQCVSIFGCFVLLQSISSEPPTGSFCLLFL